MTQMLHRPVVVPQLLPPKDWFLVTGGCPDPSSYQQTELEDEDLHWGSNLVRRESEEPVPVNGADWEAEGWWYHELDPRFEMAVGQMELVGTTGVKR